MKSTLEIMPKGIGAILKWEATSATRVRVPAEVGTKQGALVQYALASNAYFPALTDEQDGTVLIQPLNCVVDTRLVPDSELNKANLTYAQLQEMMLQYGVSVDGADPRVNQVVSARPDDLEPVFVPDLSNGAS